MDASGERQPPRWRRWLQPLRFVVSGGLLVYFIWQADPLAIWAAWAAVDVPLLLLAFGLQFVGLLVSTAKWGVLLQARGHRQPFGWLLAVYLVGQFANNFLPTTVGGDALRAIQLGRRIESYSQASASVFLERLTGFLALSLIANVAILLSVFNVTGTALQIDATINLITISFTGLAIAAVAASLSAPWLLRVLQPYLPERLRLPLERLAAALVAYFPQGSTLALVVGMSLLFQSIWIGVHVASGLALNIAAPLLLYALIVPLSDILGLLPIFFNNVGAREIIFTFYLAQVGVPTATALALAFMVFSIRMLASTSGGLVLLFGWANLR